MVRSRHPINKGLHWTQIKEFLIYVLFLWQKLMEVQRKPFPTISVFPLSSMVICMYISAPNTEGVPIHKHSPFSLLGCLIIPQAWKREEVTKLRHPWSRFITWSQQEGYRSMTVQLFLQRPRQILSRSRKDRPSWKHFKSAHFQHKRRRH